MLRWSSLCKERAVDRPWSSLQRSWDYRRQQGTTHPPVTFCANSLLRPSPGEQVQHFLPLSPSPLRVCALLVASFYFLLIRSCVCPALSRFLCLGCRRPLWIIHPSLMSPVILPGPPWSRCELEAPRGLDAWNISPQQPRRTDLRAWDWAAVVLSHKSGSIL